MAESKGDLVILIKGKTYDILKFLALVVLPALGTLYFTLAGIWGLPAAEQVVNSIVAADAFLGVLLQLSSTAYAKSDAKFDGEMVIEEDDDRKTFRMELNDDPNYTIAGKDELRFKVNKVREVRKKQ